MHCFGTAWVLREDYLGTTWRQLGDHQLNTFLLPEVVLWTIWGLLGDHYETNGRLLSDYWANNILFCNCTYISYIKCILVRIYFSFVGFCQNVSENFDEECWANKRHKECTTSRNLITDKRKKSDKQQIARKKMKASQPWRKGGNNIVSTNQQEANKSQWM